MPIQTNAIASRLILFARRVELQAGDHTLSKFIEVSYRREQGLGQLMRCKGSRPFPNKVKGIEIVACIYDV